MGFRNLLLGTMLGTALVGSAHAALITPGTPFDINGVNAVTTAVTPVTFRPGNTQAIDSGNVHLLIQTIPEAGGQEWLLYSFTTATGGTIAGNVNANWLMQVQNLATTQPVSVNHFFVGWGAGGQLSEPVADTGNLPLELNPITGVGHVFGEPVTGVIESVLDGEGAADTFGGFLSVQYGINPATINFFQIGELIGPAPVPEPGGILIVGAGALVTFGVCRRRRA
jgi:hypothetical protein